ncbi:MAG: hypothetical protein H0W13_04580 [Nitrospirales bacterium]|nr:hypothetical protein [Nitrospirales bacterium]
MKRYPYLTLTVTVGGCSLFQAKETRFLHSAQGHATEEEVQQRLGLPKLAKSLLSGESLWIYQIFDWQPGDNRVTAPGTWCDEYILSFDHERVLRRWTHKTYFHGGEAFPTYCVPDRFYLTS